MIDGKNPKKFRLFAESALLEQLRHVYNTSTHRPFYFDMKPTISSIILHVVCNYVPEQ